MWKNRQPVPLKFLKKIFATFILLAVSPDMTADAYLFSNGTSDYTVVVSHDASQSEHTAARELQFYLQQISGVRLSLSSNPTPKMIHVGWSPATGYKKPRDTFQGFRYVTRDGNLYIYGGRNQGTMYGVYAFLENELGIRWYTGDYTKIPKRSSFKLKSYNHSEKPALDYRLDFYHEPLRNPVWCARNRLNESSSNITNQYGGQTSIYGFHSAFKLVNPDKHFNSHPEYYSLRKNRRQHKTGQLCLSNPDVIRIATESILKIINDNPGYWAYDVSQEDNLNYCQCEDCTSLAEQYGGQSGLMLWYVNQLADAVKEVYPDKYLCTLAYLYTRHAPTGIVPRDNVVVRLCNIECCFSHTLDDTTCQRNVDFCEDLTQWGRLTDKIYIWDYVACFKGYLTPYPNFDVLARNLQLFSRNGAIGVLEEGAHNAPWADFSELRQWLIAKLLWNPNQNTSRLIREFCTDYYGPASKQVLKYLDLYNRQLRDGHVFFKESPHWKQYAAEEFTAEAQAVLRQALYDCSGNNVLEKRVNRLLAQVYFMQIASSPRDYSHSDAYIKLQHILRNDPTRLSEWHADISLILKEMGYT